MFVHLYLVYKALQSTPSFNKRESLREIYNQVYDDVEASETLSEMVVRYGSTKWLQPTIDIVGPVIQPNLRSAGDWLEDFVNFPEAKNGRATISFLSVLGAAILIANFVSIAFCVRAIELVLIMFFFVDKPLSVRYPRYQSIIVPLYWALWVIPTDAQTAFQYLQQCAQEIKSFQSSSHQIQPKACLIHQSPTTSSKQQ